MGLFVCFSIFSISLWNEVFADDEAGVCERWDIFTNFNYWGQDAYCHEEYWKITKWACPSGLQWQTTYCLPVEDRSARSLIVAYFWLFISILLKAWLLIWIWAIIVWWIMISMSWDDESSEWKDTLITWIVVAAIIVFAWVILHTINPIFFTI